jgi:hypothetical protein
VKCVVPDWTNPSPTCWGGDSFEHGAAADLAQALTTQPWKPIPHHNCRVYADAGKAATLGSPGTVCMDPPSAGLLPLPVALLRQRRARDT